MYLFLNNVKEVIEVKNNILRVQESIVYKIDLFTTLKNQYNKIVYRSDWPEVTHISNYLKKKQIPGFRYSTYKNSQAYRIL